MTNKTASLAESLADKFAHLSWWAGAGEPRDEAASAVRRMTRREFDKRVAAAFRCEGYAVREAGAGDEDTACDMLLTKDVRHFLVLCREWRAWEVGMETIEAFHNAIAAHGASGGFLITSGKFTADALETAPRIGIRLVNGAKLVTMLEK